MSEILKGVYVYTYRSLIIAYTYYIYTYYITLQPDYVLPGIAAKFSLVEVIASRSCTKEESILSA